MQHETQTIIGLEKRFWQCLEDKDYRGAKALVADECLIAGSEGTERIDPDRFEQMMRDAKWSLDSFKLEDVEVAFPTDDVALIAYTVREKGKLKGKELNLHCADTSTWVRSNGSWKCSAHTESILGPPAGTA